MFTSSRFAPFCTCSRAMSTAAWKSPLSIRRRNFLEPVMFCRSPTITNPVSGRTTNGSRPLKEVNVSVGAGTRRGGRSPTASAICRMCSGVVPQQPPRTLASPARANSPTKPLVISGSSSWRPIAFGSPALG